MSSLTHAARLRELHLFLSKGQVGESSATLALDRLFSDEICRYAQRKSIRNCFKWMACSARIQRGISFEANTNAASSLKSSDLGPSVIVSDQGKTHPEVTANTALSHTAHILEHTKHTLALAWFFLRRHSFGMSDKMKAGYHISVVENCRHVKLAFQAVCEDYDGSASNSQTLLTCALSNRKNYTAFLLIGAVLREAERRKKHAALRSWTYEIRKVRHSRKHVRKCRLRRSWKTWTFVHMRAIFKRRRMMMSRTILTASKTKLLSSSLGRWWCFCVRSKRIASILSFRQSRSSLRHLYTFYHQLAVLSNEQRKMRSARTRSASRTKRSTFSKWRLQSNARARNEALTLASTSRSRDFKTTKAALRAWRHLGVAKRRRTHRLDVAAARAARRLSGRAFDSLHLHCLEGCRRDRAAVSTVTKTLQRLAAKGWDGLAQHASSARALRASPPP